jgi:hypothetical protein
MPRPGRLIKAVIDHFPRFGTSRLQGTGHRSSADGPVVTAPWQGVYRSATAPAARTSASVCFGVMLRARASYGKVTRPGLSELGPLVRYQRHDELSQLLLWPMEARNPDTGHQAQ